MSKESSVWLNTMTLIGNVLKRGKAWHWRAESQGDESNHYDGPIPVEDVNRRLFNFHAVELPLVAIVTNEDGTTSNIAVPDRKAIATDDTYDVLGVFKSGYSPHQYDQWLIENVANILDDDLGISSAGLLRNRAQAWVEVSMPENVETPSGVTFRPNLLAFTSFDGTLSTTYKRTITATVCDNTLAAAASEDGETFKLKHSRYSSLRLGDAREALAIVHTMAEDFATEIDRLTNWTVTENHWNKLLDTLVPLPSDANTAEASKRAETMAEKKRDEIQNLWLFDSRVAPWKGTAFGALQAFNTHAQHFASVRKGVHRAQRNMENVLTGKTDALDASVLDTLVKVGA